jgi:hypothetical protein
MRRPKNEWQRALLMRIASCVDGDRLSFHSILDGFYTTGGVRRDEQRGGNGGGRPRGLSPSRTTIRPGNQMRLRG